MKVSGAQICGRKHQATEFVSTGRAKGSYPVYVCSRPKGHAWSYNSKHYDDVYNVQF